MSEHDWQKFTVSEVCRHCRHGKHANCTGNNVRVDSTYEMYVWCECWCSIEDESWRAEWAPRLVQILRELGLNL